MTGSEIVLVLFTPGSGPEGSMHTRRSSCCETEVSGFGGEGEYRIYLWFWTTR